MPIRQKRPRGRPVKPPLPRHRLKPALWPNALRRLRLATTFDGYRSASQYQMAQALGVGLNRYFAIEAGRRPATPREVTELARLFKVSERELLLDVKPSTRVVARRPSRKLRRVS